MRKNDATATEGHSRVDGGKSHSFLGGCELRSLELVPSLGAQRWQRGSAAPGQAVCPSVEPDGAQEFLSRWLQKGQKVEWSCPQTSICFTSHDVYGNIFQDCHP